VITADPQDQISCGKTALEIERDVVFSTSLLRDGAAKPLAMDIQMPVGGHPRPLVVYVPGGGFIFARKENALHLRTGASPPFLLFHGDHDTLVSPSQTLILHERLRAVGVRSTRYVLKGANHGDLAFTGDLRSGLPWSTNQTMSLIVDFLRRTFVAHPGRPSAAAT
jgi:acetyl esterase/lipase